MLNHINIEEVKLLFTVGLVEARPLFITAWPTFVAHSHTRTHAQAHTHHTHVPTASCAEEPFLQYSSCAGTSEDKGHSSVCTVLSQAQHGEALSDSAWLTNLQWNPHTPAYPRGHTQCSVSGVWRARRDNHTTQTGVKRQSSHALHIPWGGAIPALLSQGPAGFSFLNSMNGFCDVCILVYSSTRGISKPTTKRRPTQQNASSVLPLCWSVVGNFSKADTYSSFYGRAANILCTKVLHNVCNIWLCIWDRLQ